MNVATGRPFPSPVVPGPAAGFLGSAGISGGAGYAIAAGGPLMNLATGRALPTAGPSPAFLGGTGISAGSGWARAGGGGLMDPATGMPLMNPLPFGPGPRYHLGSIATAGFAATSVAGLGNKTVPWKRAFGGEEYVGTWSTWAKGTGVGIAGGGGGGRAAGTAGGFRGRSGFIAPPSTRVTQEVTEEASGVFARLARALGGANDEAKRFSENLGRWGFELARWATWSRPITRLTWGAEEAGAGMAARFGGFNIARLAAGSALRFGGPALAGGWALGALTGQFGMPRGWGGQGLIANPNLQDPAGGRAAGDIAARIFTLNLWRPTMEQDYLQRRNTEVLQQEYGRRVSAAGTAQRAAGRMAMQHRLQFLHAQALAQNATRMGGGVAVWNQLDEMRRSQAEQLQAEIEAGGPQLGAATTRSVYELRKGGIGQNLAAAFGRAVRIVDPLDSMTPMPRIGVTYSQQQVSQFGRYWQGQMLEFQTQGGPGWTAEQMQTRRAQIAQIQGERADIAQERLKTIERISSQIVQDKQRELDLARQVTQARRDELQQVAQRRLGVMAQAYFNETPRERAEITRVGQSILDGTFDWANATPQEKRRAAAWMANAGPAGVRAAETGMGGIADVAARAAVSEAGATDVARARRREQHAMMLEIGREDELMMEQRENLKTFVENQNKIMQLLIDKQKAQIAELQGQPQNEPPAAEQ
jgi:hypothetical protein